MKAVAPVAMMLCWFVASAALAEPTLDPSFGISGFVRVGVPSGREDTAVQSIIQEDGKVAVLGITTSRQAAAFVTRFTTSGTADPTFGDFGTHLIIAPPDTFLIVPTSMALLPDGSFVVLSVVASSSFSSAFAQQGRTVEGLAFCGGTTQ